MFCRIKILLFIKKNISSPLWRNILKLMRLKWKTYNYYYLENYPSFKLTIGHLKFLSKLHIKTQLIQYKTKILNFLIFISVRLVYSPSSTSSTRNVYLQFHKWKFCNFCVRFFPMLYFDGNVFVLYFSWYFNTTTQYRESNWRVD